MTDATINPALTSALAPYGILRACINLGNPILARSDASGVPVGVSVDLAHELARQLNLECQLVAVEKAAKSVEAVRNGTADIGFFAIDPARSEGLNFTAPYVLIEGSYLVRADSPITANDAVDREGVSISAGAGSAYDLFLTREIKAARIERVANAQAVVDALASGQVDVAAGIRKVLEDAAAEKGTAGRPGLRLLPGRFMVIEQAMGLPAERGEVAAEALRGFVEALKANGFVARSMKKHGIASATVAPAATAS